MSLSGPLQDTGQARRKGGVWDVRTWTACHAVLPVSAEPHVRRAEVEAVLLGPLEGEPDRLPFVQEAIAGHVDDWEAHPRIALGGQSSEAMAPQPFSSSKNFTVPRWRSSSLSSSGGMRSVSSGVSRGGPLWDTRPAGRPETSPFTPVDELGGIVRPPPELRS